MLNYTFSLVVKRWFWPILLIYYVLGRIWFEQHAKEIDSQVEGVSSFLMSHRSELLNFLALLGAAGTFVT
jgi:hypothetical protein